MPLTTAAFHTFACFSGATAVAFGAFGAHALKGRLTAQQLTSWNTATSYQLVHTVALLVVTSNAVPTGPASTAAWCFASGIGLFSGSIYGLCLTKEGAPIRKLLGPATPIGGLAFIAGWIALGLSRRGGLPKLK